MTVPVALIDPTYRPLADGLRAAGAYLDTINLRPRTISIIDTGVVLSVMTTTGPPREDILQFTHEELATFMRTTQSMHQTLASTVQYNKLCPTGYQDFLRAVGVRAHEADWIYLRLIFTDENVFIHHGRGPARFETTLTAAQIDTLLNEEYERRANGTGSSRFVYPTAAPSAISLPGPPPVQRPHADILEALGRHVERKGGHDVLIDNLNASTLVVYMNKSGQQTAEILSSAEVDGLCRALHQRIRLRQPSPDTLRGRLHGIGKYLDSFACWAVLVQEQLDGRWSIDYIQSPTVSGMGTVNVRYHEVRYY